MSETTASTLAAAGDADISHTRVQRTRRELVVSYLYLLVANVGGQLIGFAALAIVARRVGPHDLGAYNFASNVSSFFALPLMAGVAMVGMRELAVAEERRSEVVAEIQGFLLVNGILAYGALILLTPVLTHDPLSRRLLPIVGLTLLTNGIGLDWAMQGMQRARPLALLRFLGQVAYAAVLAFLIQGGPKGTIGYAWANVAGFGVTAALTFLYGRHLIRHNLSAMLNALSPSRALQRMRVSLAPAASLMMVQVYYTSDIIILGYTKGDHATGIYGTATRLPLAASVLASLWVTVFYPHAAQLARDDHEGLRSQVGEFASIAIVSGLPFIPVGFIIGSQMLGGMFGQAFASGSTAFAILLVSTAAALVNSTIGQTLLAAEDDRAFLLSVSAGAVANIALNFLLIPSLGIVGSAIATLVAELLILGLAAWRFTRTIGTFSLNADRLARAALAVSLAGANLFLLRNLVPWLVSGGVYVLICALGLIVLRAAPFKTDFISRRMK